MKAAVYYGPGDIRVEDVQDPELETDGIIIRVKACGICGSDLHPYRISGLMEPGMIMGHEFSGEVVSVGQNVSGIQKGDRVTAASIQPCGDCQWCNNKETHRCLNMRVLGFHMPGAFAEYVSIPLALIDQTVFLLPDDMSYEAGATIEPLSVGEHIVRRAAPTSGEIVVILGAGAIGLFAVQIFKAAGVAKIIVSEVSPNRLKMAEAMGADRVIDAVREEPAQQVLAATSGVGADIVVECAGVPGTFQQAVEMLHGGMQQAFETERADGRIMLTGIFEQPVQWSPNSVIRKSARMIGCYAGSFPQAIGLLKAGKVQTEPLITGEYPLDSAVDAFKAQADAGNSVKVLIKP